MRMHAWEIETQAREIGYQEHLNVHEIRASLRQARIRVKALLDGICHSVLLNESQKNENAPHASQPIADSRRLPSPRQAGKRPTQLEARFWANGRETFGRRVAVRFQIYAAAASPSRSDAADL